MNPNAARMRAVHSERRQLDAQAARIDAERRDAIALRPNGQRVLELLYLLDPGAWCASEDDAASYIFKADWLPGACARDRELHFYVLMRVSAILQAHRLARDEAPFSDPLPGEPDTLDLRLRKFIGGSYRPRMASTPSPRGNMEITVSVLCRSVEQLNAVSTALATAMGDDWAKPDAANTTNGGAGPAVGTTDEPKRRGRPPGSGAAGASAAADFVVYHADGSKRAGYAKIEDAAKVLLDEYGTAKDKDSIENIALANKPLLEAMTSGLRKGVEESVAELVNKIEEAELLGGDEPEKPKAFTADDVKVAGSALAKSKGVDALKAVFAKLKVAKASEIKPEQYAEAMTLMTAA